MIVLDNDVLVKIGGQDPDPTVVSHLKQYSNQEWTIPALVAWEFYKSQASRTQMLQSQRTLNRDIDRILDFSDDVALEAAYLGERLQTQGVTLDPIDMLNLATAHEAGATFVTHNSNDFDKSPIHELTDIDVIVS
ncbi:type II toxin-antitoxin system VapC family toxin [Halapricum desulfuricans]|uniref:PIN domain containing protein n=1 Tax=Halapricum desulfuricans TaxID=2841257 RepID=A0A897NEV6_9EURY|nr:type II toxin-antitoxin system VapC family toxin [Halapricum desulfuricans]QSG08906.1 PIN domain containing protein [Halapricum desulfuricans]